MSRGRAFLPDPTTPGATDDLLSKLAGEEIDKLLAEADVERPAETPAATKVDEGISSQIDQVLSEKARPSAEMLPSTPPVDPVEAARLRKLAQELEVDQPEPPARAEAPREEEDPDPEPEPAIRSALKDDKAPFWMRPLEWINSPLEHSPDWVRAAMGIVAVVTLINALAVIGYVVIFRRHH